MTVFSIFTLLGGLAFFIYGMNQMSQSLEKIAGARMRNVIDKMTKNRFLGLFMGCFITIAMKIMKNSEEYLTNIKISIFLK